MCGDAPPLAFCDERNETCAGPGGCCLAELHAMIDQQRLTGKGPYTGQGMVSSGGGILGGVWHLDAPQFGVAHVFDQITQPTCSTKEMINRGTKEIDQTCLMGPHAVSLFAHSPSVQRQRDDQPQHQRD